MASIGDHLRLLWLLRRIDLGGEAIMAVLQTIDSLVGQDHLEFGMEILHRPSDFRCAIWHNEKIFSISTEARSTVTE